MVAVVAVAAVAAVGVVVAVVAAEGDGLTEPPENPASLLDRAAPTLASGRCRKHSLTQLHASAWELDRVEKKLQGKQRRPESAGDAERSCVPDQGTAPVAVCCNDGGDRIAYIVPAQPDHFGACWAARISSVRDAGPRREPSLDRKANV